MVGQIKVRSLIKKLNERETFPRFIIVNGISGSGKSLVIDNICNNILHCTCETVISIDDIRKVCTEAVNYTSNHAIVLSNFESLNFRTKESILKLCEDIPNYLYVFIETNDLSNVKNTLINRSYLISLEPYTESELLQYCAEKYSDEYDFNEIVKIFKTPGDIDRAMKFDIKQFISFCNKVLDYIFISPISNAMKISNSLKLKSDGSGYDFDLFLNVIRYMAFTYNKDKFSAADFYKFIKVTTDTISALNSNKSLNKLMLYDRWLLGLRKADYNV